MGCWKARFSLNPLSGKVSQEEIDNWYSSTHEIKVNEVFLVILDVENAVTE